jgi:hypothetical protein
MGRFFLKDSLQRTANNSFAQRAFGKQTGFII